jgi:hypothetical protein
MARAGGPGRRRGTRSLPCSSEKVPDFFNLLSVVPYGPLLIVEFKWRRLFLFLLFICLFIGVDVLFWFR